MAKRMLIDASHPEETRVVVLKGNSIEDFDYENASRKQLKGNIYLAKVTRVEPSLQAAFVDYGGNRHGFLPFSEIHPDYYRIPVADREALLAAEAREQKRAAAEAEESDEGSGRRRRSAKRPALEPLDDAPAAEDGTRQRLDKLVGDPAEPEENGSDDKGGQNFDAAGGDDIAAENGSAQNVPAQASTDDSQDASGDAPEDVVETAGEGASDTGPENAGEPGDETPTTSSEKSALKVDAAENKSGDETSADENSGDDNIGGRGRGGRGSRRGGRRQRRPARRSRSGSISGEPIDEDGNGTAEEPDVDTLGGDEADEAAISRAKILRGYKIQEVIKRRQVLLVQVTKEERGNKGAALTTYLSLPGRFCVLMPNTARGGGISRKISNPNDRRRLKKIINDLKIPEGIAVIVRTAGSQRSKAEIRRDYDYLLRLWDEIRETTLNSTAPKLVYEEANLIKRAMRDLYDSDTEEVLVEGDEGYKAAKTFMKSLMPSHARKVKHYKEQPALYYKHKVESQIDAMHNDVVQLKSGGYIVIGATEALVAIDVNSGRSTRERHIENTAYRTNLEAAEEIARQLRLRDLAGLIVVDFIDMEEGKHNRDVERRLKDAMRQDRARIQIGRISPFGLLEMSRQRLRPSLIESSTTPCPHCSGSGVLRSEESQALHVLRQIEEEANRRGGGELLVTLPSDVLLLIMNRMRDRLKDIEALHGLTVKFNSNALVTPGTLEIERQGSGQASAEREEREEATGARRDRRRRRGGDSERTGSGARAQAPAESASVDSEDESSEEPGETPSGSRRGRRRRGKRGGRRRNQNSDTAQAAKEQDDKAATADESGADTQGRTAKDAETPAGEGAEQPGEAAVAEHDKQETQDDAAAAKKARPSRPSRRRRSGAGASARADAAPAEQKDAASNSQSKGAGEDEAPGAGKAGEDVPTSEPAKAPRRSRGRSTARKTSAERAAKKSKPSGDAREQDVSSSPPSTAANEAKSASAEPADGASSRREESAAPTAGTRNDKRNGEGDRAAAADNQAPAEIAAKTADQPPRRKRRGWWSRP